MHEVGHWAGKVADRTAWESINWLNPDPISLLDYYFNTEANTILYGFFTSTTFGYSDGNYNFSPVLNDLYQQLRPMFDQREISWSALESGMRDATKGLLMEKAVHQTAAWDQMLVHFPSARGGGASYDRDGLRGFGFGRKIIYQAPPETTSPAMPAPAPAPDPSPDPQPNPDPNPDSDSQPDPGEDSGYGSENDAGNNGYGGDNDAGDNGYGGGNEAGGGGYGDGGNGGGGNGFGGDDGSDPGEEDPIDDLQRSSSDRAEPTNLLLSFTPSANHEFPALRTLGLTERSASILIESMAVGRISSLSTMQAIHSHAEHRLPVELSIAPL